MATTGFNVNGADIAGKWPDHSYLIDRYPGLASTLKQAGLWTWGINAFGGLGNNTTTKQSSPIQTVAGGTNWSQLSVGVWGSTGIKADGTLWNWGYNSAGQLGDNSMTDKYSPVQTVAGGTNWKQSGGSGSAHSAAIKTDGTLWTWGQGLYGQLGNSLTNSVSSPIQTTGGGTNWKFVNAGEVGTTAIKTDGTLWLWGKNDYGQIGDNSTTNQTSPVQTIAGGTTWQRTAAGRNYTAAIKTDGTLWVWGQNNYGQLGTNSTTRYSSPVQTVAGGTTWKSICTGGYFMCGVKTDGTLWTWGQNTHGQLGDNTVTGKSSPVQTVAAGTNWKAIQGGFDFSFALKTDCTLWLWGNNAYGQLGDNTVTKKSSPIQTVAGGTNWKQIPFGSNPVGHVAIIRDDSADPL